MTRPELVKGTLTNAADCGLVQHLTHSSLDISTVYHREHCPSYR